MTKKEKEKAIRAAQNRRIIDLVCKKSGYKPMKMMDETGYDTPFQLYKWRAGRSITDQTLVCWKKSGWITQEQIDEIMSK